MYTILVTNDDGYEAAGLKALANAMKDFANVVIVAPANEKSACGHSLTLAKPLKFVSVGDDFYKLDDGSPTDCVYMALHSIFEEIKPDLVLSGINKGSNMGEDVTYSGTAGGAMEGALHGIKSIAFSQYIKNYNEPFDYSYSAKFAAKLAKNILENGWALDEREFLNVNFPDCCGKGFDNGKEITYLGKRIYANDAHRHSNPRGEEYWWLGLHPLAWNNREQKDKSLISDFDAIKNNKISISPVQLDLTAYNRIEKLKEWLQ